MDLAAAFPNDFGPSGPFYDPTPPPPQQAPSLPPSYNQGYQQQGQSTFNAALQTTQSAEQPVVYGASGVPVLPQMPQSAGEGGGGGGGRRKQGFADMDSGSGGRASRRELQFKKAAYTVLCFLLALSADRITGIYLEDYLANAGFEPNRTFLTWLLYPALLIAALWIVLR